MTNQRMKHKSSRIDDENRDTRDGDGADFLVSQFSKKPSPSFLLESFYAALGAIVVIWLFGR